MVCALASGSTTWPSVIAAIMAAVAFYVLVLRGNRGADADGPTDVPTPKATDSAPAKDGLDGPIPGTIGIVIAGALWVFGDRLLLALGFVGAWYAVLTIIRNRRRSRREMAEEANSLEAIRTASRALRAGVPVTGVVGILATDANGEAGRAFREIKQREELGEELPESIKRKLIGSSEPSLRAFGLVLLANQAAGGNIAETSDRLSRSLLERGRSRRRAKTILTYGRTAAMVLAIMPAAAVPMLCAMMDGYTSFIFDRPLGNLVLAAAAVLIAVGLIAIQRLGRVDASLVRRPS
jgi:tight adherence protein B